jgi:transcription elongation factor GreA
VTFIDCFTARPGSAGWRLILHGDKMATSLAPVYMTEQGIQKAQAELAQLVTLTRPEILDYLQDAKDGGDSADNTEYLLLIQELEDVDRRIRDLAYKIEHAQLIERGRTSDTVEIGSTVTVQEPGAGSERYTIVGSAEANPAQGAISNESPLGRALLNRRVGDEIIVASPDGPLQFRITSIG